MITAFATLYGIYMSDLIGEIFSGKVLTILGNCGGIDARFSPHTQILPREKIAKKADKPDAGEERHHRSQLARVHEASRSLGRGRARN